MTLKHYLLLAVFHLLSFVGCWAQNSVAPMNIGNVFMKFGETETSVPIKLTSWGKSDARSITYTLYYMETGENVGPTTVTFDQPITYGETREVIFPIKTGTKLGTADVILNITEVNGQYNEATIGSIYITVFQGEGCVFQSCSHRISRNAERFGKFAHRFLPFK